MKRNRNLFIALGMAGGSGSITYETPSYANVGGTGDRTALIIVTSNLVNIVGALSILVNGLQDDVSYWDTQAGAGKYIRYQFSNQVIITETKYYQDRTYDQAIGKWQGSNNGTDWTDITTAFQWSGSVTGIVDTSMSANTTAYTYYQFIGTAGNYAVNSYNREIEFKIANPL